MNPWLAACLILVTVAGAEPAQPGVAPALPLTGTRIVRVSTVAQLNTAMGRLQSGDTLLLADGTYPLDAILAVHDRHDVTIRGQSGSTNVVLQGRGMDNRNHGGLRHGIWSNSRHTTIAHLTLRETYDNLIVFNAGAQAPRVYCVRLIDAGSQFIKSNPTDVASGIGVDDGRVEYCWFEYTVRPPDDHGAGVGYFNGISAHAAKNWIVRGNLFKNLHNPDGSAYPWNPAVLFWRHSSNTITEQNIFLDVDRAVAYGLEDHVPYRDHAGGAIRNNFVHLTPGFQSRARRQSADASIVIWNSPGTQVDHNTILQNGNAPHAIEFRFANTTNATARNNLADATIHLRDQASAVMSGNITQATPRFFADAARGDLHLSASAAAALDKALSLSTVTNDIDGEPRPAGSAADVGADEASVSGSGVSPHY